MSEHRVHYDLEHGYIMHQYYVLKHDVMSLE